VEFLALLGLLRLLGLLGVYGFIRVVGLLELVKVNMAGRVNRGTISRSWGWGS
jgi:hypothetical protein